MTPKNEEQTKTEVGELLKSDSVSDLNEFKVALEALPKTDYAEAFTLTFEAFSKADYSEANLVCWMLLDDATNQRLSRRHTTT